MIATHIQYIIDNYSIKLQSRLKEEGREIIVNNAIDTLLACDRSQGKKLTDWLVKTYIEGGFRWEDVEIGAESKLAEVLGLYLTNFHQIPRDQRNIYIYRSYGELYKIVEPYLPKTSINEDTPGSREIRRRERARALEESEVLFRSEDMIVSVPLTQEASKWWGKGTKWCTAADKNNYFDNYNKDAPLIVITLLNNCSTLRNTDLSRGQAEKFQLWTDGNEIQFMDAQDCEVSVDRVEKNWHLFQPIITAMIEKNGFLLGYVPQDYRTPELCRRAIENNGEALDYIPDKIITTELCRIAICQTAQAFLYVPNKLITAEICRLAIEKGGYLIDIIPDKYRTPELCMIAARDHARAVIYMSDAYKTDSFYKEMVKKNGLIIKYMPEHLITNEICELAVEQNGLALGRIHKKHITDKICLLAIEQNPYALNNVLKAHQTIEICMRAVEKNGMVVIHVHEKFRSAEIVRTAVKQNGFALGCISEDKKTPELCRLAVEENANALDYVPKKFKTTCLMEIAENKRKDSTSKKWDISVLENLRHNLSQIRIESNPTHKNTLNL